MTSDVSARSVGFEGYEYMDAAYSAMLAASDGQIYTALCSHNGKDDAVMVAFDPASGTTRLVADMGVASREKGRTTLPQGKVHTRMAEGPDGNVYFGTHPPYPAGPVPPNAPSGHFIAYNLRDGTCRSIGTAPAREAVITSALDPKRISIVALTYPSGHLLVCDVKSGIVRDLGPQTNGGGACRTIGIDEAGNAWLSREPGEIVRHGGSDSTLTTMTTPLPSLAFPNEAGMGLWRTILYCPDTRLFYGIHARTHLLFKYDPVGDKATPIGSIAAEAERINPLGTFASLAFARSPDRRLFYVAPRGIFDFFNSKPLRGAAHLISHTPDSGITVDHGPVVADGSRRLFGSQNATVSRDGRYLFVLGATDVLPGEKTGSINVLPLEGESGSYGVPYQLRLLTIELAQIAA